MVKCRRSAFFARPATQFGSTAAFSVTGQRIFADLLHFAARPATEQRLTCYGTMPNQQRYDLTCSSAATDLKRTKIIHKIRIVLCPGCGELPLIVNILTKVLSQKMRKGHKLTRYPSVAKLRKAHCFSAGAEEARCCCGAGSCAGTEMCGGHVQGAVTRSGMTSIVRRR